MKRAVLLGAIAATLVAGGLHAAGGLSSLYQLMFKQGGTSTVSRTARSKIADVISVKDFGATGDGVTNDTVAVTAAVAYAGDFVNTYFPCPGTYQTTTWGTIPCGYQELVPATGAVPRPLGTKIQETLSAKDFGAVGNGVTDDTTAIGNLINAATSTQLMNFPCPGTYISSTYGTLACGVYYPPPAGGTLRAVATKLLDTISVKDYGAIGDGVANDTAAFTAAIAAVSPAAASSQNGARIYIPPGTYRTNVSTSKSHITFTGASRRSTFLVPAVDAPVFTFDSSSTSVISNAVTELSFLQHAGFTSAAILMTGSGVNDWYRFENLWISGFTNSISILGRTIWSRFINIEITNDVGTAGFYVTGSAAFNLNLIETVRVGESATGFYFAATGGSQVYKSIHLHACNPENNTVQGIYISNMDASSIDKCYIENNPIGIKIEGTWARGLDIKSNIIWGTTQGTAIYNHATNGAGVYSGNFLDTSAAPNIALDIALGNSNTNALTIEGNWDTGKGHTITSDVNGRTHVRFEQGTAYNSQSAVPSSVQGFSMIRFSNGAPLTVNNLTGGDPGQTLVIYAASSTVTLTHGAGGAGAFFFPGAQSLTLSQGESITVWYDTSGTTWRPTNMWPWTAIRNTVTYSASMTPDASKGRLNVITVTDAVAFTINAPASPATNQELTLHIRNASGGAMGAITWDAIYKMSAWTNPANANSRAITFIYNGTNWVQMNQTGVDVPN